MAIELSPEATVRDILKSYQEQTHSLTGNAEIHFGGQSLDLDLPVSDAGLASEATVQIQIIRSDVQLFFVVWKRNERQAMLDLLDVPCYEAFVQRYPTERCNCYDCVYLYVHVPVEVYVCC